MMDHTATVLINIAGIPHWPISHERLQDPVILDCVCKGTLSRGSFVTWYQHLDGASTKINGVLSNCPICGSGCNLSMSHPMYPYGLREMLEAIVEKSTSPGITAARARSLQQVGSDLIGHVDQSHVPYLVMSVCTIGQGYDGSRWWGRDFVG